MERHLNPPLPPPSGVLTHRSVLLLFNAPSACRVSDEAWWGITHRDYLSLTLFFLFFFLRGFFVFETEGISWTKGCRTSEGEVFAGWSCMISVWMEMRDRHQCKTSALWQKHSQLLFMWPAEREEWFSVRFNFRSLKKHLQRTELLCGLLFPLQSLQKLLPAHHITSVKKLERRL